MRLFKSRSITVEALQYTGNDDEVEEFAGAEFFVDHDVSLGDVLVKNGSSIRVYDPREFVASFEPLL